MKLKDVDLNLLVVLQQLLTEKHVSNAALTLGVSQPTVSRALGKLRKIFSDPLLVETQIGYALTPKAAEIQRELSGLLLGVESLLSKTGFDPSTSKQTLRLFGLSPQMGLLMPHFMQQMRQKAPNMTVDIDCQPKPHFDHLHRGDIHFVITARQPSAGEQNLYSTSLYQRPFCLVMSKDHPLAQQTLTEEALRCCQFGQISLQGDQALSIEPAFKAQGLCNHKESLATPVRVNDFAMATALAETTDLVFHLPLPYAQKAAETYQIVCKEVPVGLDVPEQEVMLYWHKRFHDDPMCQWAKGEIKAAANALASSLQASY